MTPAELGFVACTRCGCKRPLAALQGTKCSDTEFCAAFIARRHRAEVELARLLRRALRASRRQLEASPA